MRREEELTKHAIHFVLHGYENSILSWLKFTENFFEANGYPLKSVSYDINRHKFQRKSLKAFCKQLTEEPDFPVDWLYSFCAFAGASQKHPDTWYFGCEYDAPNQVLKLFFDTSFPKEDILSFYKNYLNALLKTTAVWTGYLFDFRSNNMYSSGDIWNSLNYYKENAEPWSKLMDGFSKHIRGSDPKKEDTIQRFNLDEVVPSKNMYRHIYEQNILSQQHMDEKFDGLSLTEWIDKNKYGAVEKIGTKNWLWTVPKEKLYEVQVAFYNKGLLLGVEA